MPAFPFRHRWFFIVAAAVSAWGAAWTKWGHPGPQSAMCLLFCAIGLIALGLCW